MLQFSALADPTRMGIIELLAKNGRLPASNISRRFPVSPPAISQHLKVLREAGLVKVETKAQQRIYTINPTGMGQMEDWLHRMRQDWEQRFDALDALLQDEMKKLKLKKRRPKHGKRK